MTLLLLLLPLSMAAKIPDIFPSCLQANTTWNQSSISSLTPNIGSPELCQELCDSSPSCQAITWLTSEAPNFPHSCATFSSPLPSIPCTDCVSGPSHCDCSMEGECEAEDGNVVSMFHDVLSLDDCLALCQQESRCQFYTYFGDNNPLRHFCFIYDSCNMFTNDCTDCLTGVMECKVCSFEDTAPDGSCLQDTATGLLMAGGYYIGDLTTVEFWAPLPQQLHCTLPSLSRSMHGNTVDFIQQKLVVCHKDSCDQLTGTGWISLQATVEDRWLHTSVVIGSSILLVGGYHSPSTTELMPVDGGESQPSFSIWPGRWAHCMIKTDDNTVVLTGGKDTESLVIEYSGLGLGEEMTTKILPSLTTGRWQHACGLYEKDGVMTLIVTGGTLYEQPLSSTEIYDYSQGTKGSWKEVSPLPSPRQGIRGASVAGVFHVTSGFDGDGSYLDQILAWDPSSESWSLIGNMSVGREWHAVTEVPLTSVTDFCTTAP